MNILNGLKLICLIFLVCSFSASTLDVVCNYEKNSEIENSEQYSEKFDIKIYRINAGYHVTVHMPTKIDGIPLFSAYLYKGRSTIYSVPDTNDEFDFYLPLGHDQSHSDKYFTYFQMGENQLRDTYIGIKYGDTCGMWLEYPINNSDAEER